MSRSGTGVCSLTVHGQRLTLISVSDRSQFASGGPSLALKRREFSNYIIAMVSVDTHVWRSLVSSRCHSQGTALTALKDPQPARASTFKRSTFRLALAWLLTSVFLSMALLSWTVVGICTFDLGQSSGASPLVACFDLLNNAFRFCLLAQGL